MNIRIVLMRLVHHKIDKNPDLTIIKMDADTLEPMRNVKFKDYECELKNGEIHHV